MQNLAVSTGQFDDIIIVQWYKWFNLLQHAKLVQPKRCLYIHLQFQGCLVGQHCQTSMPALVQNGDYLQIHLPHVLLISWLTPVKEYVVRFGGELWHSDIPKLYLLIFNMRSHCAWRTCLFGKERVWFVDGKLVGGLEHIFFIFPRIYIYIRVCVYMYVEKSSQLTSIFQRGRYTTNQVCWWPRFQ